MKSNKFKKFGATAAFIMASSIMCQSAIAETDVYRVQRGDSLWEISRKYKVDLWNVIDSNPQFENPNLIYPEQKVIVPLDGNSGGKTSGTTGTPQKQNPSETPQSADKGNMPSLSESEPQDAGIEQQVIDLVNKERASRGLKALSLSTDVAGVARYKSEDMMKNNYFSHQSPKYGSPFQMLANFGVKYSTAGENIAKGQKTAASVVNAWMNSEGHRKNILSSNFTEIGIGYTQSSSGTTYWTQIFIKP